MPFTPPTTFDSPLEAFTLAQGNFGRIVTNPSANDGHGTVTLTNAVTMTMAHTVDFCPYASGGCPIRVAEVTADANGNGSANFTFPQKGTFAGVFRVLSQDGRLRLDSGMFTPAQATQIFHLVKSANVTPLPSTWAPLGSDPLDSGAITINGTAPTATARLELHRAAPNMEYGLVECDAEPEHTPVCTSVLGSFTTDSTGFASVTFTPANTNPAIYEVKHGDLHEFVTGFIVQ